jgi:G3E family GTPase
MARNGTLRVSILTGFLGSGKTTLLSRLLAHPRMGETAVIVNELGEVAIDHHLLRRVDERTVVLASGCLCCTLRGDLADELRDLLSRRERGELPPFRRVVVETTGLADPAPILSTLVSEPVLRHHVEPESVVATVDAVTGPASARRQREWLRQAAAADRIVVTKADLVAPAEAAALRALLARVNPAADVLQAAFGDVDPARLFGRARRAAVAPAQTAEHVHAGDVRSFALVFDEPLDWSAFGVWLTMLLHRHGADVLRVKGLLDVGGEGPVLLNGVQHVLHPPEHLARWPDGDRRTRIVFIVRGLAERRVRASLETFQSLAASGSLGSVLRG